MVMKKLRETMIEAIYEGIFESVHSLKNSEEYNRIGLFDTESYTNLHDEFCKKHVRPEGLRNKFEEAAVIDAFELARQSHKDGFFAGFKVAMALLGSGNIDSREVQDNE